MLRAGQELPQCTGRCDCAAQGQWRRADGYVCAADLETVVDHIMHVVDVAGWDHVGIGGDFDGTREIANGIHSVADYPKLIQAVMRRGATDEQIKKLVGENILR